MTFKDSGIEWLGEIPEHWEVVKIKHVAKKLIGGGTPDTSISDYWGSDKSNSYLWVSIEDITKSSFIRDTSRRITQKGLEASSAKIIPPFSILYSIYASLGKIAYSDLPVTTNQAILAIQPKKEIFYKFLFYILHSTTKNIIMLSSTTTQNNISLLIVQNLKIPLPPIEEQKAIAEFLDSKCKQIESFVDKKQKLISLLNEKKQALINECVTKGLSALCHCKALTRHSKDSPSCHSEALAEESTLLCHSERSEESKNIETQDTESRCFAIAQHDNPCHSEDFPPCHSDLERSEREESLNAPIFDSVIVVTDRKVLDSQIRDNVKGFEGVSGVVEAITQGSRQLKNALEEGKKIIITTIQKFPYILDEITSLKSKTFAIIIDEAHSS